MAIDKAVDSAVLEAGLTTIANAIREKGGTSDTLAFPDAMAEAIAAIAAGGGNAVVGEFTLTDSLTTDAPLYINNAFTQNTIPLVFGFYEKPFSSTYWTTDDHTVLRAKVFLGFHGYYYNYREYVRTLVVYSQSGLVNDNFVTDCFSCPESGYASVSGVYGLMLFDLAAKQIRFKPHIDGSAFIPGRTYCYYMLWDKEE